MTQGFDRNVQVLSARAFEKVYHQATSLNIADPSARLLLRLLLGNAIDVPGGKASLPIPDNLRAYAGLQDTVLLVGQGDYFELWSPDEWQKQEAQVLDAEANASRFAALALGNQSRSGA